MDAYDLFLRGVAAINKLTKDQNREARHLCAQATDLDVNYSAAYMCLSMIYVNAWLWSWEVDPQTLERAFDLAQRAVALDDFSPAGHMALGDACKWRKQLDRAIAEGQRSIALGPSCSACYGELAETMMCAGNPEQALQLLDRALRLDPYRPDYQFDVAFAHLQLGRHDQAVDEIKQVLIQMPDFTFAHEFLAVLYADAGKTEEAKAEAAKWLALLSPLTVAEFREHWQQSDPCVGSPESKRHFFDTLDRLVVSQRP
jgi:adenylate cyclase